MARLDIGEDELRDGIEAKRCAVDAEAARLRHGAGALAVRGRPVIVVDDGVATGGTARAALQTLRARGAASIVLAIPVGSTSTVDELASLADEVVCLHCEETVYAVSHWYTDFAPTTDADVTALLERRRAELAVLAPRARRPARIEATARDVRIPIHPATTEPTPRTGPAFLRGALALPPDPLGLVICTHGAAGEHATAFEHVVADGLRHAGLATLDVELLTDAEQRDAYAFDIAGNVSLLASRLIGVTDWARGHVPQARVLDVGYFGLAAGAAAALAAAAHRPDLVRAVVSAAGRPDLAEEWLGDVRAPTLLIVGGLDGDALTTHRETLYFLCCESRLEVVHDAAGYFDEPEASAQVVRSAQRWFLGHLGQPSVVVTAH
jgi:putative phosphoribosyl transferase